MVDVADVVATIIDIQQADWKSNCGENIVKCIYVFRLRRKYVRFNSCASEPSKAILSSLSRLLSPLLVHFSKQISREIDAMTVKQIVEPPIKCANRCRLFT